MTVPREPGAPIGDTYSSVPLQPRASVAARIVAALGAILILLGGATVSFATILLAPIGMLIAAAIWRQRGKSLPVVGHWVACVCMAAVIVFGLSGITAAFIPSSSWTDVQKIADSVSRATNQPPARTPAESAGRAAARRAMSSPKAMRVGLAYGLGFAAIFMALIFGTIGWVGGMLAGFAAQGRWPGTAAQPSGGYTLGNA